MDTATVADSTTLHSDDTSESNSSSSTQLEATAATDGKKTIASSPAVSGETASSPSGKKVRQQACTFYVRPFVTAAATTTTTKSQTRHATVISMLPQFAINRAKTDYAKTQPADDASGAENIRSEKNNFDGSTGHTTAKHRRSDETANSGDALFVENSTANGQRPYSASTKAGTSNRSVLVENVRGEKNSDGKRWSAVAKQGCSNVVKSGASVFVENSTEDSQQSNLTAEKSTSTDSTDIYSRRISDSNAVQRGGEDVKSGASVSMGSSTADSTADRKSISDPQHGTLTSSDTKPSTIPTRGGVKCLASRYDENISQKYEAICTPSSWSTTSSGSEDDDAQNAFEAMVTADIVEVPITTDDVAGALRERENSVKKAAAVNPGRSFYHSAARMMPKVSRLPRRLNMQQDSALDKTNGSDASARAQQNEGYSIVYKLL